IEDRARSRRAVSKAQVGRNSRPGKSGLIEAVSGPSPLRERAPVIVLPYGHDQSVYGRQWVTFGLIALNFAVFALTWWIEGDADAEIERRAQAFTVLTIMHPEARIDASAAEGANDRLRELLERLIQDDPEA